MQRPRRQRGLCGAKRLITSRDNAKLKLWLDLLTGKGLRRHGLALLAGVRQVEESLRKHPELAVALIVAKAMATPKGPFGLEVFELAPALFAELDVAGTKAPLLLLKQPEVKDFAHEAPWPKGCTLFVGFQNPDNVGAVIRSAAAFGAARIVLLKEAAHPFLPKSVRAAGPALLDVALEWGPSIAALTPGKIPLISLDAHGEPLAARPWPETFGLLAGLEGPGVPTALRQGDCRSIPMAPDQESLNGATAVAIALYAWNQASLTARS